jgi:arylsulfatase A-like enzyme
LTRSIKSLCLSTLFTAMLVSLTARAADRKRDVIFILTGDQGWNDAHFVAALDELKLADDTIIFYSSDNGAED